MLARAVRVSKPIYLLLSKFLRLKHSGFRERECVIADAATACAARKAAVCCVDRPHQANELSSMMGAIMLTVIAG